MSDESGKALRNFIKAQYIANFLIILGVICFFGNIRIGLLPLIIGCIYRIYQRVGQRDLYLEDRNLKKRLALAKNESKTQAATTAKEIRRMRIILGYMSLSFALFILGIFFYFFSA